MAALAWTRSISAASFVETMALQVSHHGLDVASARATIFEPRRATEITTADFVRITS
jgi:hypothetical protein